MKRPARVRTLRFEGLETRLLLAADLFAPQLDYPVADVCLASCSADFTPETAAVIGGNGPSSVIRTVISDGDSGSREEIINRDLAFAELGAELNSQPQQHD